MATIINNTRPETTSDGNGFLVGVILVIVFAFIFIVYLLPRLGTVGSTQTSVPSTININTPKK